MSKRAKQRALEAPILFFIWIIWMLLSILALLAAQWIQPSILIPIAIIIAEVGVWLYYKKLEKKK